MTSATTAAATASLMLGLTSVAFVAQEPTFSTRVEQVRLDALVSEKGRPLTELTAADFQITDNGITQQAEFVSFDTLPMNLVLALDMSESVEGTLLTQLRQASRAALAGLRPDDQGALVTFSHAVSLAVPLTRDLARITQGLDRAVASGGTALIDAAYTAMWLGQADPGRTVLVVFSDGVDTFSWLSAERVIQAARRANLVVYGVTTAGRQQNPFLADLSEITGGRLFDLSSSANLQGTFTSILSEARQRYVISYTPRGVARPGWHKIELRIKDRRADVSVRKGYLAGAE